MKNPEILPQEYQIDFIVEELGNKLNNHLETYFDTHETFTIDGAEDRNPVTYIGIFTHVAYCYNPDLSDPHAYKATHEAFFFAAHIGGVLPGGINIDADDYFGSGLSDMTTSLRYTEAIVQEVHEALSALDVHTFTLLAHSIAGVYGLVYANQYTNEIEAFVGIDTAVVGMDKYITPDLIAKTTEPTKNDTTYDIKNDIADVEDYVYSSSELAIMQKLYDRNCDNDDVFEKIKKQHKIAKAKIHYENMQFPDHIPTLFLLSSESVEMAPWYVKLHDDQCTTNPKSFVKVLKGQHFLHHNQSKEIAQSILRLYT